MKAPKIKTVDVEILAECIPHDRIWIAVRKDSLNTVACEGIGQVEVNDCDVGKAVSAFFALVQLGL